MQEIGFHTRDSSIVSKRSNVVSKNWISYENWHASKIGDI